MELPSGERLELGYAGRLSEVAAETWDALFDPAYPFTRYSYLSALERYGCVTDATGWEPAHALLRDARGALVAAAPLYLKHHSWGEFVFDFSWAEASRRMGKPYYPRLVSAIPFTPAQGPRLGGRNAALRSALAEGLRQSCERESLSSAHLLFVEPQAANELTADGWLERQDIQFQWHDQGYENFDAFVAQLSSEKRKKLLRERRRVSEAGIRFETRSGADIPESVWQEIYALYANTYEERGQAPYLTPEFLIEYGGSSGSPFHLILGYEGAHLVAAALTVVGGDTLYGRHWGAAERFHSLHFECCYHQGIELCLRLGLKRFDAGTQGAHKQARGFLPVITRSLHHLRDPRLSQAVADFLTREREAVQERLAGLMQHNPYRHEQVAG